MKHKHCELIHAWADGAEIEWLGADERWFYVHTPTWKSDNHYRVKDPYRKLKAAAADPTKQIRDKVARTAWVDGGDLDEWLWQLPVSHYEIRDKPKAKVKMWQWIYKSQCGRVYLTAYFSSEPPTVTAAEIISPALWTEIEVDAP